LNEVLHLNLAVLRNSRKEVLNAILIWWRRERERICGPVPRTRFERERDKYVAGGAQLTPYCQVAVWWVQQRLLRMER
jgi:hypothetical protein